MSGSQSDSSQTLSSANSEEVTRISAIVFLCISLYNSIELAILIFMGFKRYRTLYFWALLTSAVLGVIPLSLGSALQYLELAPVWLTVTLSLFGFYFMVPGQSVVLSSRLHLVSQNRRMLFVLRWLLIVNTVILLIPMTALYIGWAFTPSPEWNNGYNIIERIQVTGFSAQETLLSVIYIVETVKLLNVSSAENKRRTMILYELFAINLIAISMDIVITVLEYLGLYFIQVILKPFVYSIKLKLEYAVLGMLVSVTTHSSDASRSRLTGDGGADYNMLSLSN